MDELTSHCDEFYTGEERAILEDTATTIAKYECFLHLFEEGCMNFLGEEEDEDYEDEDDNYYDDDYYNYDDEANLEATLACTNGTYVGDALMGALDTCFEERSGSRKKPFSTMMKNRDDDECYAFDDIMAWVMQEYGDDACVLQAIGWMDENYALVEDKITTDIMSLPKEVQSVSQDYYILLNCKYCHPACSHYSVEI